MLRNKILISLVLFSCGTLAQPGPKFFQQADEAAAKQYAETIRKEDLKKHLEILASDEYEGRETGKRGQKKAAQYLADYYQSLGVAPCNNGSYFQEYPLRREGVNGSSMEIGGKTYAFLNDFFFYPSFECGNEVALDNMVFVGYGIDDPKYSDYKNVDVKGKVVLCLAGEPRDKGGLSRMTGKEKLSKWSDYGSKIDAATTHGASSILFIDTQYGMTVSRVRYWLTNPQLRLDYPEGQGPAEEEKADDGPVIPYFFLSPETADALLASAGMKTYTSYKSRIDKKFKPVSRECKPVAKIHVEHTSENVQAENVLCYIEGSDPELRDEIVIISAHYDHIGISEDGQINNGADDDGSGTVTSLEIAQAFVQAVKDGKGPRRSILILNVSGEEKGLLGSEWYSEYPIFPLEKTDCDLNVDMIGRIDKEHQATGPNYVYLIGSDKLSTELHALSEKANNTFTKLTLDYTYNDPKDPNRYYYRSDHYNFAKHGVPVIFYFSGVHEDYHKPGDDEYKIMYDKMETIARLVFYTAWEVANRDEKLKVDVKNDFQN